MKQSSAHEASNGAVDSTGSHGVGHALWATLQEMVAIACWARGYRRVLRSRRWHKPRGCNRYPMICDSVEEEPR